MIKTNSIFKSPAMPAAILLYGIIFLFALWSYLNLSWQRGVTIALYGAIAVWGIIVIFRRWRVSGFAINRIDVLFCVFLFWVLVSVATHWWEGNIQYLEYMPFFVVLPYLLGRMMNTQDVQIFKTILLGMAGILLLLLPYEYWKNSQPGYLYTNAPAPVLFEQGHGTMLAGLLFSAALLVLISKLMLPVARSGKQENLVKRYRVFEYFMLVVMVSAMIWIASRGPAVATVLGIAALFLMSSYIGWKKKSSIFLLLIISAVVVFSISFQNKYSKAYYELLFQRPTVVLEEIPKQVTKLEYGKPILGESICKDIPNSITDRWIHYRTAWEIFLAKPLMGVGANSYGFYSCTGPGWFPHTTILQVLAELGVLGGVLYFALMWMVFRVPISRCKSEGNIIPKANMGWLLAFAIFQFTVNQFNGNYFLSAGLYFVIGLSASYLDQSEQSLTRA